MNDFLIVEVLLTLNILRYDIDFVDGNIIGELARRSVWKYETTVRLFRHNNHNRYVSDNNSGFERFRHYKYDTFSEKDVQSEGKINYML